LPYISKAERERARWMTLAETLAHIAESDGCDRRSALKQLCGALGDNQIIAIWEDSSDSRDRPTRDATFWQPARFRGNKVFDPSTERWRTLLINKSNILEHWPERSETASVVPATSESQQASKDGSNLVPIPKVKIGAPSHEDEIHQALDRLSQRGCRVKTARPAELYPTIAAECGKQIGDEGFSPRSIRRHLQSWRTEH
jgi:hypothetical protein